MGLKRYADAEAAFTAVLQINPNWDVPYKNLAKTYIVQGNITEAIDVIRNGFKITQDPLLGLELATHLDRSGERELAARNLQSTPGTFSESDRSGQQLCDAVDQGFTKPGGSE